MQVRGSVRGPGFMRLLSLAICLVGVCPARRAQASETYPPKVQEAMSKRLAASYCVPQCILCHKTNQGGIMTLNPFGKNLQNTTMLRGGMPSAVTAALDAYFVQKPDADSDSDGTSDVKELEVGDSPAVAGVRGANMICPDIRYGCGARIAPVPPPVDRMGLFSAGLVVLGVTLLRRRRELRNAS